MLLSVIVPVYNVEKYLKKCLLSIVHQTFTDMEIIVVNDGSTDSSLNICKSVAAIDSRVVLIDKANGGLSNARNCGLNIAQGKYIAFLDSDDYICENAFEKMVESAESENLDIVIGYPIAVFEDGKCIHNAKRRRLENVITSGEDYLIGCIREATMLWPVQLAIYKHHLIEDLKFKEGVLHEDMLWTPQVFLRANRVKCLDFEFYYYLSRSQSITHSTNKYKNGCDLVNICRDLEKLYSNVVDKQKRAVLMDNLAEQYLNGFYIGRLLKKDHACLVSRRFLLGKAKTPRNILKTLLFIFSKRLYIWLNDQIKKKDR